NGRASVFQTDGAGSIPVARSGKQLLEFMKKDLQNFGGLFFV
ncbi:MAG: hypothetical protein RIS82_393, partial [Actinomycetota bacterium]